MALTATCICNFGWKAHDFKLKGVDGKVYTLDDVRGPKGTLVIFICNHCPYVRAVIGRLVEEANTIPLFGGKRAVWVKVGQRSNIAPAVEMLLAAAPRRGEEGAAAPLRLEGNCQRSGGGVPPE